MLPAPTIAEGCTRKSSYDRASADDDLERDPELVLVNVLDSTPDAVSDSS
jgi:hypothetical protein